MLLLPWSRNISQEIARLEGTSRLPGHYLTAYEGATSSNPFHKHTGPFLQMRLLVFLDWCAGTLLLLILRNGFLIFNLQFPVKRFFYVCNSIAL